MSLFDFFQPSNDIDTGRSALAYFHNAMVSMYSSYRLTLTQVTAEVSKNKPEIFLTDLGFAINTIELSDSGVKDAMENLAKFSGGSIPGQAQFFQALSNRKANLTFGDYVGGAPEIAAGMATDVVKGAQQVGDAVLDTGKSLLVIGPILAVAAIVFIGYAKTRQVAGR